LGPRGLGGGIREPSDADCATDETMEVVRSDAELLAAVADGDRGALQELHARHQPWVRSRMRRRCSDADIVAEAVQDTFVAVWRGAAKWDGRGEPAAWIWGIAIRRLIGSVRKRRRWLPVAVGSSDARVVAAEEQILLGVEYGDLGGALASLSPELRAAIQATVLDGLTTREAARLLGIPAGTVKTRVMRAKQQLRGALA
jgi:RNA polymerase sigma-70 factor, ECF subfamily